MKKSKLIIILVVVLLIIFSVYSIQKNKKSRYSSEIEKINQFIKSKMDKSNPVAQGLSVALVDENGMFWSKGYGYADVKREIKADAKTLYRVGSVTKPITATAIMMLVDRGKIQLDDPITNYIPQFSINNQFKEPITVRHLLSHQSGLLKNLHIDFTYQLGADNPPSYKVVLDYLKKEKLLSCPGEKYRYSNVGYTLLGKIVENVSGTSYRQFIKQEIFTPLRMDNSYVGLDKENNKLVAKGYDSTIDNKAKENKPIRDKAAGSIISNAEDLSKYLQFILNHGTNEGSKQLLSKNALQKMFKKQSSIPNLDNNWYGLGWQINPKSNVVGHLGLLGGVFGGGGYHSLIVVLPEENLGVVLLSNTTHFHKFSQEMTMGIVKRLRSSGN